MGSYYKNLLYLILVTLAFMIFFDVLRATRYQDEVMFQSILASDYVLANARDTVASSTGNIGNETDTVNKIKDAFNSFVANEYNSYRYKRSCSDNGNVISCDIVLNTDSLPINEQFKARVLDGRISVKLAVVTKPYMGRTIYGIGVSTKRDLVSLTNFGAYAKTGIGTDENTLLKTKLRADRTVYLLSSY
jgi:hypothetical protein